MVNIGVWYGMVDDLLTWFCFNAAARCVAPGAPILLPRKPSFVSVCYQGVRVRVVHVSK